MIGREPLILSRKQIEALAGCVRELRGLKQEERLDVAVGLCKTLIEERAFELLYEQHDRERADAENHPR